MSTVLLIIQLVLSAVLTVLVLLQRSEGGALGIGGGGGGFMSGRSAATSIVRVTSIVGVLFVINCIALTIAFNNEAGQSVIEGESAATSRTANPVSSDPAPLTDPAPAPEGTTPSVETILDADSGPDAATAPDETPTTEDDTRPQ